MQHTTQLNDSLKVGIAAAAGIATAARGTILEDLLTTIVTALTTALAHFVLSRFAKKKE